LIDKIDICDECMTTAINVKKRKRLERELIAKYDNKSKKYWIEKSSFRDNKSVCCFPRMD
jgi:hypothetical protein